MLNSRTQRSPTHANADKQHIKKPLKPGPRKPKFFKKLFAATEAVTRAAEKGGTC
jgi:hypothetical protein